MGHRARVAHAAIHRGPRSLQRSAVADGFQGSAERRRFKLGLEGAWVAADQVGGARVLVQRSADPGLVCYQTEQGCKVMVIVHEAHAALCSVS